MEFVNRTKELEALERQYREGESSFVVIYGRRRVGKTTLISRFLDSHPDSLYFLATEEAEHINLAEFRKQAAAFIGNGLLASSDADWLTVFRYLAEYRTRSRKVIVIDEFQYIGEGNKAFPSIMQKAWDTVLKGSDTMLIICGSVIRPMESQVLMYGSPLYGRRTAQIRLKQIPFRYYHGFFQRMGDDELVPYYAFTGGVPKYVESVKPYGSVFDAIDSSVLNTEHYLYEEPYFLLRHEVSEIGSYFSLLKAIAMGNRKLADIAASVGVPQNRLTSYLKTLMDMDMVEREVPVTETNPEKSKNGLYRIKDNFVSFWFRFIYPYRAYIERGETAYVSRLIKERFIESHVSYVYEDICRERMWDLSAAGAWDFPFDRVGSYWGKACSQVDIVAIDDSSGHLVLGECKYSSSPKSLDVLHSLEEKGRALSRLTGIDDVRYIIFSKSGFTEGVSSESRKRKDLKLVMSLSDYNRSIEPLYV